MMCNSYNGLTYYQIMASIISWHFFEGNSSLNLELIYIIISENVCLSVWPLPWKWQNPKTSIIKSSITWTSDFRKNFPSKWPVAKLLKKIVTLLMLFNGKVLLHIFAVHFQRALRLVYRYHWNHRTHRKVGVNSE
jgi:hypothetical protein